MFLLPYTSQHVFTEANKHNKANKSKEHLLFFPAPYPNPQSSVNGKPKI